MSVVGSGTFELGGELAVHRLGFGAMRITGAGVWGHPPDVAQAKALCHRVLELGVDFIDTADSYGPEVSEYLLAEALHPYPQGLVIATKGGMVRGGPGDWRRDGRPTHLEVAIENSLRRLRVDTIDLYQLHAPDPEVPFADSVGALARAKEAGKIRHVGLSNVSVDQLEEARGIVDIASVQNRYNLGYREKEDVLQACEAHGIGYIPWYPLAAGKLEGLEASIAEQMGATPAQVALAWLLAKASVMLPIPGTSSVAHLEENCAAADLTLAREHIDALEAASAPGHDAVG